MFELGHLGEADFQKKVFSVKGVKSGDPNIAKPNLRKAYLIGANFKDAELERTNLRLAAFHGADLRNAKLATAKLQKANLDGARLNGTSFNGSRIEGAKFHFAHVDKETSFKNCSFDTETDFTGTDLDKAGIDPGLKAAFKDNIRRIHWQAWIEEERKYGKRLVPWLVEWFWKVTDFGSSTKRIIKTFFALAFAFAGFYWLMVLPTLLFPQWQGIIKGLWQGVGWIGCFQTLIRSVYFSIVHYTLGFGDMHAAESGVWASVLGNIFLSLQVEVRNRFLLNQAIG
jgi:hypothetical protein